MCNVTIRKALLAVHKNLISGTKVFHIINREDVTWAQRTKLEQSFCKTCGILESLWVFCKPTSSYLQKSKLSNPKGQEVLTGIEYFSTRALLNLCEVLVSIAFFPSCLLQFVQSSTLWILWSATAIWGHFLSRCIWSVCCSTSLHSILAFCNFDYPILPVSLLGRVGFPDPALCFDTLVMFGLCLSLILSLL